MKHWGSSLGGKCGRSCTGGGGVGIHQVGGYDAPQSVRDATTSGARSYAPKGGRPAKRGHEVVVVESEEAPPPTPKGKAPTPFSNPSKVAKVAADTLSPRALDVGTLAASVTSHATDACQTLAEQAAATGVEAALAKVRAANHWWALTRAEKVPGNTQRALHLALDLANKRGGAGGGERDLKEAQEGRRKAEVEAAQLRVEVEALRKSGEDLQQRPGVVEAQVRSLPSTLSATYSAHQGAGPLGGQSQGSGSRNGSQ